VFVGTSVSVARFVTLKVVSSRIVRLVCAGNVGALLVSLTVTVKLFVALLAESRCR